MGKRAAVFSLTKCVLINKTSGLQLLPIFSRFLNHLPEFTLPGEEFDRVDGVHERYQRKEKNVQPVPHQVSAILRLTSEFRDIPPHVLIQIHRLYVRYEK